MARLLIRLNGSPADEIDEIHELLTSNHINFYETDAGRWGISVAGFWLADESQWDQATALLRNYQQQRYEKARAEYEDLRQRNEHDTLLRRFKRQPLTVIVYIVIVLIILYLSLSPFWGLL